MWKRDILVVLVLIASPLVTGQKGTSAPKDGIYQVGGDVTAPRPVSTPMPPTPNDISKEFKVRVSFVVAPDGSVTNVRILKHSKSSLDDFAVNVVRTWKFEPAKKNGNAVAVRLETEMKSHR
jgi:periplasmic protein TonB